MLKSFANPVCSNSRMTGGGAHKVSLLSEEPLASDSLWDHQFYLRMWPMPLDGLTSINTEVAVYGVSGVFNKEREYDTQV